MADQESKPARDEAYLELLQLHRKAVLQNDSDISELFERKLREYRERLVAGEVEAGPLTPETILDFAVMHGLISPRRQKTEWNTKFNASLLGFAASVLAAAAPERADAQPQAASVAQGWTDDVDANAALLMLDRLDVSADDDARVDAIAANHSPPRPSCTACRACAGCVGSK